MKRWRVSKHIIIIVYAMIGVYFWNRICSRWFIFTAPEYEWKKKVPKTKEKELGNCVLNLLTSYRTISITIHSN
jgi:hypothetical protein